VSQRIVVLGGGTMGAGIAYVFAVKGFRVDVVDPSESGRDACVRIVKHVAARAVERGGMDSDESLMVAERISVQKNLSAVPAEPLLLIEAVPEDFALKADVLNQAQSLHPKVLATNTSSISITSLAQNLDHPESFIGMHFFNPVWSNPLVEIVVGAKTATDTVDATKDLVDIIGKESITVGDNPGFASSRLGVALGLEAIRMVSDGVASAADIDKAMELGYRHPMGPLRLTDLVGLDVRLGIARNLTQAYGARFEPPQLLIDMVERGDLGKKSGQGFFSW
jgi:3-hydroxybutyryl-CoA dehydrogenase